MDFRGGGLTPYQREMIAAIVQHKRISGRGPRGLGKTAMVALVVLWFAETRDRAGIDWKVVTTAGAWRQLTKYLWPELHKWARRLRWNALGRPAYHPRHELMHLSLKLTYGEAFAAASDVPDLIEGAHADHLLFVYDESKSILPDTFDASEGAFSGAGADTGREAYAIAISTPGAPNGRFYDIQSRKEGYQDWWVRRVTLEETIAAGRVSAEWVEARRRQWGEDSAVFRNHVLGEFADSDEDGLIPLSWIEVAIERWHAWDEGGRPGTLDALGVDVGRTGDNTVLAHRHGMVIARLERPGHADTMATAGRVKATLDHHPRARAVIDVIGIGAGVVDRLREQGYDDERAVAFNASERTDRKDRADLLGFANARAAAWWALRDLLNPANGESVALPDDATLIGDLTAPHWRVLSGGKILIEDKDEIKKRLGRSPDDGDAVVMAFWEPEQQPTLQSGPAPTLYPGSRPQAGRAMIRGRYS